MIRSARAADIMAIVGLMREAHGRSQRRLDGDIDEKYLKDEVLAKAIFYDGPKWAKHPLGTQVLVADRDGRIVGLHIGAKSRVGVIGKPLFASDVLFYVSPKATAFTAPAMVRKFEQWAWSDPRVIEVKPGVNSDVMDWHMAAAFYERLGYVHDGAIMKKAAKSRAQGAAA